VENGRERGKIFSGICGITGEIAEIGAEWGEKFPAGQIGGRWVLKCALQ
jgi:hypothetical protein